MSIALLVIALIFIAFSVAMMALNISNYQRSHTPLSSASSGGRVTPSHNGGAGSQGGGHPRSSLYENTVFNLCDNALARQQFVFSPTGVQISRFGPTEPFVVPFMSPYSASPAVFLAYGFNGVSMQPVTVTKLNDDHATVRIENSSSGAGDLSKTMTFMTRLQPPLSGKVVPADFTTVAIFEGAVEGEMFVLYRSQDGLWASQLQPPSAIAEGWSWNPDAPQIALQGAGAVNSGHCSLAVHRTADTLLVVTDVAPGLALLEYDLFNLAAPPYAARTLIADFGAITPPNTRTVQIMLRPQDNARMVVYDHAAGELALALALDDQGATAPSITVASTLGSGFDCFTAAYSPVSRYLCVTAGQRGSPGARQIVSTQIPVSGTTVPAFGSAVSLFAGAITQGTPLLFWNGRTAASAALDVGVVSIVNASTRELRYAEVQAGAPQPGQSWPTNFGVKSFIGQPAIHCTERGTYMVGVNYIENRISAIEMLADPPAVPFNELLIDSRIHASSSSYKWCLFIGGPTHALSDTGEPSVLLGLQGQAVASECALAFAINIGGIRPLLSVDVSSST